MTEPDFLRATRTAYDAMAVDYAAHFHDELADLPLDRALFAGFAELVRAAGGGPVADVGCGPGRLTAHLHGLGLTALGIDLSPEMIAVARRTHPELRFDVGSMTALDVPDGTLGGVVAYYSIIHVPQEHLPGVFAEFHRVLAPGGQVFVVFQLGDERWQLTEVFGRGVSLDSHRRPLDRVADLMDRAGLVVHARALREPRGGNFEKTRQGYLLARKPPLRRPATGRPVTGRPFSRRPARTGNA